ncbi:HNH endonuclease family protein, partial [Vibrio parahaemolyticus V-223/04]
MAKTQ